MKFRPFCFFILAKFKNSIDIKKKRKSNLRLACKGTKVKNATSCSCGYSSQNAMREILWQHLHDPLRVGPRMRPPQVCGFHTCWLMRNVRLAQMYDNTIQHHDLTELLIKNRTNQKRVHQMMNSFLIMLFYNVIQVYEQLLSHLNV
jgi:hypothetical protein